MTGPGCVPSPRLTGVLQRKDGAHHQLAGSGRPPASALRVVLRRLVSGRDECSLAEWSEARRVLGIITSNLRREASATKLRPDVRFFR